MELNFDKEIDTLLRQTAKQESLFAGSEPVGDHLDADEISVFAENAVPEKSRLKYSAHLADCVPCRESLSALISLNSEEPLPARAFAAARETEPEAWYRKLFVFPNLAYSMGALVIAFAGITAFIVFQNYNLGGSDIAMSSAPARESRNESDQTAFANANASVFAANSLADRNSSANMADPESLDQVSDERELNRQLNEAESAPITRKQGPSVGVAKSAGETLGSRTEEPADKARLSVADAVASEMPAAPQATPMPAARKNEAEKKDQVAEGRIAEGLVKERDDADLKTLSKSKRASRQVSGKQFNFSNGVWFDSAYTNQQTKDVNRGTGDYRNLDSGLRSIAEKFTEPVVVVWKEKAYKIQ